MVFSHLGSTVQVCQSRQLQTDLRWKSPKGRHDQNNRRLHQSLSKKRKKLNNQQLRKPKVVRKEKLREVTRRRTKRLRLLKYHQLNTRSSCKSEYLRRKSQNSLMPHIGLNSSHQKVRRIWKHLVCQQIGEDL